MLGKARSTQETDQKFPSPPSDGISSLSLNGYSNQQTNVCVATSWDNTVSFYEIQTQNKMFNIVPQGQIKHDAPALCSDICPTDNVTVFSGGCDGYVKMWNVTQGANTAQNIGKHEAPVRNVKFLESSRLVVSSSWDKTIRLWDTRQQTPTATFQHNERIYAMDAKGQAIVAVTADKQVHVYDTSAGRKVQEFKSPLQYQTRCCQIFADNKGFAMGCVEGRIAIESFDELQYKHKPTIQHPGKAKPDSFVFKCHRDGNDVFSVNTISFSPQNTFCSGGSDGVLIFWDKDARYKLANNLEMLKKKSPITDCQYNPNGSLLVYSASYDWSKGSEGNDPNIGNNIFLHKVQPAETAPKKTGR